MDRWKTALSAGVMAVAIAGCGDAGQSTSSATACAGMTALEAAQHYEQAARRAGASKRFVELVTKPTPEVEDSPGYPRLVGAFYASTLPPKERAAAAAACAKELAAE